LISVVMPVRGVRAYLTDCLDSVLGQPGTAQPDTLQPDAAQPDPPAIEVIAVDDASPDGCGALLDERAGADSRLTVVHLEESRGPGNARNVGLAKATGSYVWFVDGDDLITPGALARIGARLALDHPDVLLIDYEERYPDGRTRPSSGGPLLRSAPAGAFSLAEAPQLVGLSMTAWSKVLRRDFLLALGEPFRPGIHEDIPVTCAALFAGRLSALDQVCYSYRRSRPGSFMATTSSAHWDVFGAYDEVLGMLAKLVSSADPVATPAVQSAVFERAIGHYASVLQTTGAGLGPVGRAGLVPRSERRRFFSRMHADFVRYRPPAYRVPAGARGAKLRLIERDAYWTYELLEPVNKLRVTASRALGAASHRARAG
jgi:CDP-glycerol glycerophosphotransferase